MPNKQKIRGDDWERAVLRRAEAHGITAERTRAGYTRDAGDIHLFTSGSMPPAGIVQCKNVKTYAWTSWFKQLKAQQTEANSRWGFLAVKRSKTGGQKPDMLAVMPLDTMLELVEDYEILRSRIITAGLPL